MDPLMIAPFVIVIGLIWLMSSGAKKAQQKQLEHRKAAIVLGNNVVTTSGFFGRIVDIDGDAVTLESPAGDETVWLATSIMAQMDIPFADLSEADLLLEEAEADSEAETEVETAAESFGNQRVLTTAETPSDADQNNESR
ncbi:preprotein translocase subunit YajC [Arcanobacterium hippocoleae]|uniref:Preprotein translocase subunit YajC n=1 Tax=Arcanobacterium hippocoleae TaxID=149017 RepID=A0ABU1T1J8_9ACTO|nr:preprotein translocase subunit YajC [Arcanobacterium hippocoleae]MDR6938730.1 preprotein translocase subunit YajC [Arcanobacterium hippocoleae]